MRGKRKRANGNNEFLLQIVADAVAALVAMGKSLHRACLGAGSMPSLFMR